MGHILRKVPGNWEHPKDENGHHIPLKDGMQFTKLLEEKALWDRGFYQINNGPLLPAAETGRSFEEYHGSVEPERYTPDWPAQERTHYVWYEDYSEGTPESPVCASLEELAEHLVTQGEFALYDDSLDFLRSQERYRYPVRTIEEIENEILLAEAHLEKLRRELAEKKAAAK
jgi:hypothetical protein